MKFRPGVVLVALAAFLCLFLVVQSAHIGPTPRWQGWENAIPDKLFKMMFDDLKAIARYESSLPVLKNNKKHTRWWPVGKRPKIVLEEVMLRLRDMVNPGSTGRPFAGFEWWSQVVPAGQDGPIGFHLDKDESVASNKHYLLHAEWNSIFYMTDVGGCTLVLDQHSPTGNGYEPAHPEEGDLICPRSNRYLIFNGTLLHGVLPGRPEHVDDAKRAGEFPKEGNRITFLINWWYQKPEGPNCELLPYKEVPGLRLLSKKQLKRLREEVDASVTEEDDDDMPEHARSFFMDLSDSNPDRPPTYWHKYDLPGENFDRVRLPLKLQRGGVYSFNWKAHPGKKRY